MKKGQRINHLDHRVDCFLDMLVELRKRIDVLVERVMELEKANPAPSPVLRTGTIGELRSNVAGLIRRVDVLETAEHTHAIAGNITAKVGASITIDRMDEPVENPCWVTSPEAQPIHPSAGCFTWRESIHQAEFCSEPE